MKSRFLYNNSILISLYVIMLLLVTLSANAATIDQSVGQEGSAWGARIGGTDQENFDVAQIFTVGLTGVLSRVDLLLSQGTPTSPEDVLLFDIRPIDEFGKPLDSDSSALFTDTIPRSSILGTGIDDFQYVTIDLGLGISVTEGDSLALVLRSDLVSGSEYRWAAYDKYFHGIDYSGGDNYFRSPSYYNNEWQVDLLTLGFNTHVSTVPIPTAFWLFGSGLIALISAAKRKKA